MSTHLTRSTAPFHRPGGHGCARTWQGWDWPPAGSRGQTRASRSVSGSPCGAHPTRQAWPPCEGTGPAARPRSARRTGRAGGPIRLTQETAPAPDGSLLVLVGFRPREHFGDAWTRFATFRTMQLLRVCGGQTFGHRGPERRGAGPCYETLVWPVSASQPGAGRPSCPTEKPRGCRAKELPLGTARPGGLAGSSSLVPWSEVFLLWPQSSPPPWPFPRAQEPWPQGALPRCPRLECSPSTLCMAGSVPSGLGQETSPGASPAAL